MSVFSVMKGLGTRARGRCSLEEEAIATLVTLSYCCATADGEKKGTGARLAQGDNDHHKNSWIPASNQSQAAGPVGTQAERWSCNAVTRTESQSCASPFGLFALCPFLPLAASQPHLVISFNRSHSSRTNSPLYTTVFVPSPSSQVHLHDGCPDNSLAQLGHRRSPPQQAHLVTGVKLAGRLGASGTCTTRVI